MWYRDVLSFVIDYLIKYPLPDQVYKPGTISRSGEKKKK